MGFWVAAGTGSGGDVHWGVTGGSMGQAFL